MTILESAQRQAVVHEALTWRRTPFHHEAMVKGAGVDCALLIWKCYSDLGLIETIDPRPYSSDWMLHRSEEKFLKIVLASAHEITAADAEPGDVVLFKHGRCFAHGGIITVAKPLTIVHAFAQAKRVVEEEVHRNAQLAKKLATARYASYWGKAA